MGGAGSRSGADLPRSFFGVTSFKYADCFAESAYEYDYNNICPYALDAGI
jgi:hypothetical protein